MVVDEQVTLLYLLSSYILTLVQQINWLVVETAVGASKVCSLKQFEVTFVGILVCINKMNK